MKNILPLFVCLALLVFTTNAEAAEFLVDKQKSSITVKVKATGGGFTGTLTDYNVNITGDATSLEPKSGKITWQFSDLDTLNKKRNTKMLSWLESGTHPNGEFTLKKVLKKTVLKKTQNYAIGTIKFHGISKQVVFPVTTTRKGNSLTVTGQAGINTTDFSLPIIRMALVATVKPEIEVHFSLTGTIK